MMKEKKIHYLRHDKEHAHCGRSIFVYQLKLTKNEKEVTCEPCKEGVRCLHAYDFLKEDEAEPHG